MALPKVVAVKRGELDRNVTAETPEDSPNVRIIVMDAARIVLVRSARTAIQAFLSALGVGIAGPLVPGVSDVLPPGTGWEKLYAALLVAVGAALLTALQNAWELLGRLDQSHPELRA
jgi:predicted lysophospholipase L1 biosynthesis ABC-type transport system permease subunit